MKISNSEAAAPRDPESLRIGKDEMNLVEHPFALLQHHNNKSEVWQVEWENTHPTTGKKYRAVWKVAGGADIGLPGPVEEKLYLVLLEMTREQGWQREILFSRGDLVTRLGLNRSEPNFRAVTNALERLTAVSIRADRSFWDAKSKDYLSTVTFGIIDQFKIADEPRGRKAQGQLPLSAFLWNEVMWDSFKAGHLRSLDTGFALSLKLPLALRLFRYLDKHRYGKTGQRKGFEIEIHKLCEIHLGMTPSPYASKLKERLAGAHHELIERGFLAGVVYRKMKTKDAEKVCYSFLPTLMLAPESEMPVNGPETSFSGLRAVFPLQGSPVDSVGVLKGFLMADEDLKAQACDAVFEDLPVTEQSSIKARVKAGLAPFLQENLNTPGARGAMARGIRKEIELCHKVEMESEVLKLS